MDNKIDRQTWQLSLYDHTACRRAQSQSLVIIQWTTQARSLRVMMAGNTIPKWHAVNAASTRKPPCSSRTLLQEWDGEILLLFPPLLPPFAL
jgi:hypothetical protein